MNRRQEQSLVRRFFASRMFLFVAFVLAIMVAFGYARAYYQDYKIRQNIKSLQEELRGLENKKLESMEILKYVVSPEFVEEKARTELNMKKPGENVVIVDGLVLADREKVEDKITPSYDLKNPIKWWYYFTKSEKIDNIAQ